MKKINQKYFEKYYLLFYTRKIMKSRRILGKKYRRRRICIKGKYKTIKTYRSRINFIMKDINLRKGSLYLGPFGHYNDPELKEKNIKHILSLTFKK